MFRRSVWLISTFLLVLLCFSKSRAGGLQMVGWHQEELELTFDGSGIRMSSFYSEGRRFDRVDLPESVWIPVSGTPATPVLGALIGIPFGSDVTGEIIEADYETRSAVSLMPVPTSRVIGRGEDQRVEEVIKIDEQAYKRDFSYPLEELAITPAGMMRDQRVAAVSIRPVRYNPVTKELRIARRMRVSVRFKRSDSQQMMGRRPTGEDRNFESAYGDILLNAEQARAWRGRVTRGSGSALRKLQGDWYDPVATYYKIRISEDGIYRLDQAWFDESGISLQAVDIQGMKMFVMGEEVPLEIRDDGDGIFDDGEGIFFFGQYRRAPDRDFTSEFGRDCVYWLSLSGDPGLRFDVQEAAPTSGFAKAEWFRGRVHAETDSLFDPLGEAPDANRDHWFWGRTGSPGQPGSIYEGVQEFPVTVPVELPGLMRVPGELSQIRVGMHALNHVSGVDPDHRTVVRLGDAVLTDDQWDGKVAFTAAGSVSAAELMDTTLVTLATPGFSTLPGTIIDAVLLNWVEVTYPRSYLATGGVVSFSPEPTSEGRSFTIGGFRDPDIKIYNIRDGRILSGLEVLDNDQVYQAEFELSNADGEFIAVDGNAILTPAPAELDASSDLRGDLAGADYVIVTHNRFRESADQLADHRRAGGLSVRVVDVIDIYDEFSNGNLDPESIRTFMRFAYDNWNRRPTYLLLFGRASFDHRDYFNQWRSGRKNYVPALPFHGITRGYAFSDHYFGAVSGEDPIQDVFVGRFSVNTSQEAQAVVRKVTGYDLAQPARWNDRVLYMANHEVPPIFVNIADSLAKTYTEPLGIETFKVYNAPNTPPAPNEDTRAVIEQINEGRLVVDFLGHGSVATMSRFLRGSFQRQNYNYIKQITNGDRLPMVVAMSCLNGQYADPRFACLAEEMTVKPDGGAISYVSSSELAFITTNNFINTEMFKAIFQEGSREPARGLALAKASLYAQIPGLLTSLLGMNLIGDPAQRLAVPPGPDYTIAEEGIQIQGPAVLTTGDSVTVKLKLENYGIVTSTGPEVVVLDLDLEIGETDTLFVGTLEPFGQTDSLGVFWHVGEGSGRHALQVLVDPADRIAELDEGNNRQELGVEIFGALRADQIMPRPGQVLSTSGLRFSIESRMGPSMEVQGEFEVSSEYDFSGPDVIRSGRIGGLSDLIVWEPNGISTGSYYWRARLYDDKDFGAWSETQPFKVAELVPVRQVLWQEEGIEALRSGTVTDLTVRADGTVGRVMDPPPIRFNSDTREASFLAEGLRGTAVIATDGTYLYTNRFFSPTASYPGTDVFQRIGTGFGGTTAGQNFGPLSDLEVKGVAATFHGDGFIYADDRKGNSLIRISPLTGEQDRVTIPDGLLEFRTGFIFNESSLITSDGTYIYNVAAAANGTRREGWTVRVFDPADQWRLVREYIAGPTSTGFTYLFTDGVVADGKYLYLIEFGTGLTHRVRVVDAMDGSFVEEFESDQAQTDILNGQYDWVNNKVWLGQLNGAMIHRYRGRTLPESGSLTSGTIGPASRWERMNVAIRPEPGGRVELDVLGELTSGEFVPLPGLVDLSPDGPLDLSEVDTRRIKLNLRLFGDGLQPSPGLISWSLEYQPVSDIRLSSLAANPREVRELEPVRLSVDALNRGPLNLVPGTTVAFYSGPASTGRLIGRIAIPEGTPVGQTAQVTLTWNTAKFSGTNLVSARVEDLLGRPSPISQTVSSENPVEVTPSGDSSGPEVEILALDAFGEVRPEDYLPAEPRLKAVIRDTSGIDANSILFMIQGPEGEVTGDLGAAGISEREGDQNSLSFVYSPRLVDGTYMYQVTAHDQIGNGPASKTMSFKVSSDLNVERVLNVPNPMADDTEFTYILSRPSEVTIRVYTVSGRLIRILDNLPGRAGYNQARWDGLDADGHPLANGTYLYTLTADDGTDRVRVKERLIVYR